MSHIHSTPKQEWTNKNCKVSKSKHVQLLSSNSHVHFDHRSKINIASSSVQLPLLLFVTRSMVMWIQRFFDMFLNWHIQFFMNCHWYLDFQDLYVNCKFSVLFIKIMLERHILKQQFKMEVCQLNIMTLSPYRWRWRSSHTCCLKFRNTTPWVDTSR